MMKWLSLILAPVFVFTLTGKSWSDELHIGVAAPLSGPFSKLGEQVRLGADMASSLRTDERIILQVEDDRCTAEGGEEAARRFAERGVNAVVGFVCTVAIEAALPVLRKAGIPVVTPAVRTPNVTRRGSNATTMVFRLAPRANDEVEAVARILIRRWRDAFFAIIDDGTIYGRELAEGFRLRAEDAGLKPVFVDGFRPQLDNQAGLARRLRKSGATHVFVGGDRDDVAVIARDAEKLGLELEIAAGEALRAAPSPVDLRPGLLMIGLPDWMDEADQEILAEFELSESATDGYMLPAFAATQIASEALIEARESDRQPADVLTTSTYSTIIGTIEFEDTGDLKGNPFRLFRFNGTSFVGIRTEP
jgi:branched-chain amino acid transport system substrate-binding protein